jgi:death on curing protein
MRYLSLSEVIELHKRIMDQSGGASGLRDLGGLESAIAQPRMIFGGQYLYPTLIDNTVNRIKQRFYRSARV